VFVAVEADVRPTESRPMLRLREAFAKAAEPWQRMHIYLHGKGLHAERTRVHAGKGHVV
jgi:hypothetical protein